MTYPVLAPDLMLSLQQHTGYDGGSIQGRWTRSHSENDESTLQFSYDKTTLDYPFAGALLNNLNADFQRRRQTGERNEIYWGAGYRQYWDSTSAWAKIGLFPGIRCTGWRPGVRDEFQILPGPAAWLPPECGWTTTVTVNVEYQPSSGCYIRPVRCNRHGSRSQGRYARPAGWTGMFRRTPDSS